MIDETTILTKTIGDATYYLRRRLGWRAQQTINAAPLRIFVEGRQLAETSDLTKIAELEVRLDTERQTALRLKHRLVDGRGQTLGNKEIDDIPGTHVTLLVDAIEKLEAEETAEAELLANADSPFEAP